MPAAQRNFPYNRKPSDFNQADWLARHTTLLNEHRDRWIQSGYDVRVESQNAFQLRGHSAILAGKPDLLVLNKNCILITDSKTGQEQPWHKFQVMTYMYALPMALPEYRDFKFAGESVYNDRTERVPQGGIDQGFVRNLGSLIRRIAAPEPPVRLPSAQECRFCDITAVDCPDPSGRSLAARSRSNHRLLGDCDKAEKTDKKAPWPARAKPSGSCSKPSVPCVRPATRKTTYRSWSPRLSST